MDPSYSNGGQSASNTPEIPGVKPGVIASGPDTPDMSSNGVPILNVGTDSQNPNGVFTRLTRRTTDSRPITPQPIDKIMLDGGGGPRQSKRGLLIAGLALIGVALVAGIVALVVMGGGGSDSGTSVDKATALNNLTRYMVFGDVENENDISNIPVDEMTFMNVAKMWTYESRQEYFAQMGEYLDILKRADGATEIQGLSSLDTSTPLFEELAAISYTDVVWTTYLAEGADGVQNYSTELQELETNDEYFDNMIDVSEELITVAVRLYTEYTKNRCISDGVASDDCITDLTESNSSIMTVTDNLADLRLKVRRHVTTLGTAMYYGLREMNGIQDETGEMETAENE